MIPVILSGGSGTRLWPLSRKQRPKQFLPVVDETTLFQSTIARLNGLEQLEAPLVVCNEDHRFMVAEQLRQLDINNQGIILEPVGRNTAPAIALAALHVYQREPKAKLLVLPADHTIENVEAFHKSIEIAQKAANEDYLVTFGIIPQSPETGYGYIQSGDSLKDIDHTMTVKRFVEKHDKKTAESYLQSGDFLWNSGMFMFQADTYLKALETYQPDILHACKASMDSMSEDGDFIRVNTDTFSKSPDISIDYAVMEQTSKAAVVPLSVGWNDVGAWSAVWEVGQKDDAGNVIRGDAMLN